MSRTGSAGDSDSRVHVNGELCAPALAVRETVMVGCTLTESRVLPHCQCGRTQLSVNVHPTDHHSLLPHCQRGSTQLSVNVHPTVTVRKTVTCGLMRYVIRKRNVIIFFFYIFFFKVPHR